MLIPWPSSPLLSVTLGLLFSMAAMGVITVALLRKLDLLRVHSERRLDELNSRLNLIESRLDSFTGGTAKPPPPRDGILGPELVGPGRSGGASFPRPRPFEPSVPPGGPPLIAVPNLAAEEDEPDLQAESELVKRHAEVWPLAAAGMPPAEISRQTGQPIGQVELIVGLYRRLHASRGRIDHARSD
jgi:hypothetical protein